ncbi:MAG: putative Acetyl-CoA synthetase, partial [Microgenomates group bacterium GW2011_GWC1_43_11]
LGTLIMLGVGGIFVEVMKDVTFRFAPLMYYDADQMIHTLKSSAVFHGTRGKQPLDRQALIEALLKVSSLAINHPEITELDINPLLVKPKGQGVIALDCRLTVTM